MTIPSALSLIVTVFPDRQEQARAIGAFGACGATGNSEALFSVPLLELMTFQSLAS
jgi:hypothetical protein